jgi:hypothetical protein
MRFSQIAWLSVVTMCIGALPVQAQTPVNGQATLPLIGNLVNSGFEAGLSGWTVFTTANGTLGPAPLPTTVSASINRNPVSQAAVFVAGQVTARPAIEEGGGVFQWFRTRAGSITISADVAGLFDYPGDAWISDSARFWLIIDGQIVTRLDLGQIQTRPYYCPGPYPGTVCAWLPGTASAVLSGTASVSAGPHYVMIAITRVYPAVNADPPVNPSFYQFLDNVTVTWTEAGSR